MSSPSTTMIIHRLISTRGPGEYEAVVRIEDGVVEGRFPRRALRLILEWYDMHADELMEDWVLAEQRRPLRTIQPLE